MPVDFRLWGPQCKERPRGYYPWRSLVQGTCMDFDQWGGLGLSNSQGFLLQGTPGARSSTGAEAPRVPGAIDTRSTPDRYLKWALDPRGGNTLELLSLRSPAWPEATQRGTVFSTQVPPEVETHRSSLAPGPGGISTTGGSMGRNPDTLLSPRFPSGRDPS